MTKARSCTIAEHHCLIKYATRCSEIKHILQVHVHLESLLHGAMAC